MTRVVALGGGHGLSASLSAIRQYASEVSAVVSVADDGADDVEGQVAVGNSGRIAGVWLVPDDPQASPAALQALAAADQIVIGPGSLFTSVLAVVAVPAIRKALAAASGQKVYVCNLR